MGVDRCYCRQVSLADLVRLSREEGADLPELVRRTGCGSVCGLCRAYVLVALRTGRTDLPIMPDEEFNRLMALSDRIWPRVGT